MRITVKAYGALAWAIGKRTLELELSAPATVGDLLAALGERHEALRRYLPSELEVLADALMVIVGADEVVITHSLSDGDEVLLVVPASGGATPTMEVD